MTPGVAALTGEQRAALVAQVMGYSQFDAGNDPYGEHDFGVVIVDSDRFFFKVDYYDRDLELHSTNPADRAVSRRVLTLMRADEY